MINSPHSTSNHILQRLLHSEGLRALRHRNFRLFIFGQLVSVIGTWMQSTAQQWLVYRLTGSQLKLGTVTFAGLIPVLLFSLFMGLIVDRFPRRKLLIATQTWYMILAAVLAVLTYLGIVEYWHIILLAVLLGFGNALNMPAQQAFYVDIVDKEDLLNAIAINSSVFNGARIIGPAFAGIIVATIGEAPAFAINSLSYLAVIIGLLMIRITNAAENNKGGDSWTQFKQGMSFLVEHREVFGLVCMVAVFSVFGFPYLTLLPAVAVEVLNTGPEGFGILLSSQGIGALIGALLLAGFGSHIHKGRILLFSRFFLAGALFMLAFSTSQNFSIAALILAGFSLISNLALTNTLVQMIVPDEVRGRIISAYTWSLGGFFPIGSLLFGGIGDALGVNKAILIAASCSLLTALLSLWVFPETKTLS